MKTGKLLWQLLVYQVKYDPKLERDVQEVYITNLNIVDGKLEVLNEAGDRFIVDLKKQKVTSGAGRVYQFKDEKVKKRDKHQAPNPDETNRAGLVLACLTQLAELAELHSVDTNGTVW